MRRSTPCFRVFLLFLLVPACTLWEGCMARKGRVEMGPLYYRREIPRPEATETAILWPLFQKYETPSVRQFAFRPLLNIRSEETGSDLRGSMFEVQALWPVGLYRRTEGPTRLQIRSLPFFSHVRFQHPDGPEEVDTALYPFFLTGRSSEEGGYFAFFPFGGTLRGFFGKDRIRFALFPLYADTTSGEHRSWHVLWPIFRYSKGEGRTSFRCFPLFGWKKKEDWYRKVFVLWPFFARVQSWLGTDRPTDSWFFLPFYAKQQTPFGKIDYFMYPFFSYQRNDRPGNRFQEWTLPWPFVQITRGDQQWRNSFWPFWGKRKRPEYLNTYTLFPIYRHSLYGDPEWLTERRYVLPLYWSWQVTENGRFSQGRYKGWPFFDYTVQDQAAKQFRALSPLWFWRPEGGFERNYSDFWTLYKYRSWADGLTERRILWYPFYSGAPEDEEGVRALEEMPPESADSLRPSRTSGQDEAWSGTDSPALGGRIDQVEELNPW